MARKRRGARRITIDGVPFAWLAGRSFVEIRNLDSDKAYHVPKHRLTVVIEGWEEGDESDVVLPHCIEKFVRENREEHELL